MYLLDLLLFFGAKSNENKSFTISNEQRLRDLKSKISISLNCANSNLGKKS